MFLSQAQPGRKIQDWPKTDVEPVLAKEGLSQTDKFSVFGVSMGTIHAMAMAQYFGPQGRIRSIGIRAPFVPLCVSKKHQLPNGQPSFPTTEALQRGSFYAWQVGGACVCVRACVCVCVCVCACVCVRERCACVRA